LNLKGNIVVIGDVMLDVYISGQAHRLSPEGPHPVVLVDSKTSTLGGAGNVALNLAELGCRTWLFGVRGADSAGVRVSEILAERDIEDRLLIDQVIPTTTKTRVLANSQQLLRFDEERLAAGSTLLKDIDGVLEQADAVIMSDYAKGILSNELARSVISSCKALGIPVLIDPKQRDWRRYQGATVIKPNVFELEKAAGEKVAGDDSLAQLASGMLHGYGFEAVLVTLGPRGMLLVDRYRKEYIPSLAKEVFDVSGAGDTVVAVMAACMCSGYTVSQAARVANVAAGIVVGKLGTKPITLRELEGVCP
jgi:D-beta-D-heptose 7-phosphate kinase/D-beta-D-heptose 1-phosphate adenosyltransferase